MNNCICKARYQLYSDRPTNVKQTRSPNQSPKHDRPTNHKKRDHLTTHKKRDHLTTHKKRDRLESFDANELELEIYRR